MVRSTASTCRPAPTRERATVAFGLHVFHHDDSPFVVLQRVGNPQYGSQSRLEVLAAEPDAAAALLAEVREEAMRAQRALRAR